MAAPAGYTVNRSGSYLQNDAAIATYGRIDIIGDYPNIVATDNSGSSRRYAANALMQRAYEELSRACQLQDAYNLVVVPALYAVQPGQTIDVVYDEWRDGYHAVAINDTLWVLDVETSVSASGDTETVALTVATVDTLPVTDSHRIARSITTGQTGRSQATPESGLTNDFIGDVAGIRVRGGKVTNVTFRPETGSVIEDGYHAPPPPGTFASISTVDGKITSITYTAPA
jgi:hypothetical protein